VVDVFEVMVAPTGELCIIMELVTGQTLREALWKHGPLPPPAALAVMIQLADTVAAAHAQRIIHRDLKPENVFLVPDPLDPSRPRVRILDFGIAKVDDGSARTATGTQMGTATYMAPEQFRDAKSVDHRTDVYALGCVFFELLAGRPPFAGRNLFEQMQAHLTQAPPLDALPPGTPPPRPRPARPDAREGSRAPPQLPGRRRRDPADRNAHHRVARTADERPRQADPPAVSAGPRSSPWSR
jgi:serine/threonine protein kinase